MENIKISEKRVIKLAFGKFIFLVAFILPLVGHASDIVVSPGSRTVNLGEIFTLNINVSSPGQEVNAVSGSIKFDSSNLEVISISKTSSIITFWAKDPTFSNTAGTISFEGVSLGSGYQGPAGRVISVTFKAKKTGNTLIDIQTGSVLANDGLGTETIVSMTDGTVNVLSSSIEEDEVKTIDPVSAKGILIKSDSHSDEDQWYSVDTVKFTFDLDDNVKSVQTILSESGNPIPYVTYTPAIKEKTIEDLDDGIWYFGIRQLVNGSWSKTYKRKVKIDTTDPYFKEIRVDPVENKTSPVRTIVIDASDDISGVEKYLIKINGEVLEEIKASGYYKYQTPHINPGTHDLEIVALDFAGNQVSEFVSVEVKDIPKPLLEKIKEVVGVDEEIVIEGRTDAEKVWIYVARKNNNLLANVSSLVVGEEEYLYKYEVLVDDDGRFRYVINDINDPGIYVVWTQSINSDGASSYYTDKYEIIIRGKSLEGVINILGVFIVPVVIVVALFALIIFIYAWIKYKLAIFKKRFDRRRRYPEHLLYDELELLQSSIDSHLAILHRIQRGTELSRKELTQIVTLMNQLRRTETMLQRSLDGVGNKISTKKSSSGSRKGKK